MRIAILADIGENEVKAGRSQITSDTNAFIEGDGKFMKFIFQRSTRNKTKHYTRKSENDRTNFKNNKIHQNRGKIF